MSIADQWARLQQAQTELLTQLAIQRRESGLAWIELAARELPGVGHVLARRALADKHPAVGVIEDPGDDVQRRQRSSQDR